MFSFFLFFFYFLLFFPTLTSQQNQNWREGRPDPLSEKNWGQISARVAKGFWRERHFTTFIIDGLANQDNQTYGAGRPYVGSAPNF